MLTQATWHTLMFYTSGMDVVLVFLAKFPNKYNYLQINKFTLTSWKAIFYQKKKFLILFCTSHLAQSPSQPARKKSQACLKTKKKKIKTKIVSYNCQRTILFYCHKRLSSLLLEAFLSLFVDFIFSVFCNMFIFIFIEELFQPLLSRYQIWFET